MAGFGESIKKAFYLGVGVASYAGEKAGHTLKDLQEQTQVVVNELVARGEMTTEEAQRLVNDMVNRAQATMPTAEEREPRRIEILDDEPSHPRCCCRRRPCRGAATAGVRPAPRT